MNEIRAIAFHLPQFHPIPENNKWWGEGFTEWRNVVNARPLYPGHYQPHIPSDLGFYDLRLPEARMAQAKLAQRYGIHGFCYYHYWFNGKRVLERPINEILSSGEPDFPFCLCWANENWTRRWDGNNQEILLKQDYSEADDLSHIRTLIPIFRDPRYIKINGKPLFLVYRSELLPDPIATVERWRHAATEAGLAGLYLVRVESYESVASGITARSQGFDADVEFPPFSWKLGGRVFQEPLSKLLRAIRLQPRSFEDHNVIEYDTLVQGMLSRERATGRRFCCVTPSWDNTARRKRGGYIFHGSSPEAYKKWLDIALTRTQEDLRGEERLIFINAWNEWAEGNHLEPDLRWGHSYLKATQAALLEAAARTSVESSRNFSPLGDNLKSTKDAEPSRANLLKITYWRLLQALTDFRKILNSISNPFTSSKKQ